MDRSDNSRLDRVEDIIDEIKVKEVIQNVRKRPSKTMGNREIKKFRG